jgi:hypothetical protein
MSEIWYYAEQERSVGPLTLHELRQKLLKADNAEDVLVWGDKFRDWKMAGDVPELRAHTIVPPPLSINRATAQPNDVPSAESHPAIEIKGIAGWLVLPVLGTLLAPFYVAYGTFQLFTAITNASPNINQGLKSFAFIELLFVCLSAQTIISKAFYLSVSSYPYWYLHRYLCYIRVL